MIARVAVGVVLSVLVGCGGDGSGGSTITRDTVVTERVVTPSSEFNIINYNNGSKKDCEIVTLPSHGVVIEPQSCTYHFNAEKGYVGEDHFVVRVKEYSYDNPDKIYRIVEQQLTMYIYLFNAVFDDVLANDTIRYSKFIRTASDTWGGYYTGENLAKGIGDFNGDGIDDFAISRRQTDHQTLPLDVAIIYGQANLPKTFTLSNSDAPFVNPYGYAFRWNKLEPSNGEYQNLGWVEPAGDFNNDSYNDLIMTGYGRVIVFGGNESPNLQQEILGGNASLGLAQSTFFTDDSHHSDIFGSSSLGDVNGDLIPEFNFSDGWLFYLISGSNDPQDLPSADETSRVFKSAVAGDISYRSGWRYDLQTGAGDVNGDGLADFILKGVSTNNNQAQVEKTVLFYGSTSLQRDRAVNIEPDVIAGATTFTWSDDLGCGEIRGILDDVDGDGFDDIAIGCENYAYGGLEFVDLIYGGALPSTLSSNAGRRTRIEGDHVKTAISLGDINGDGFNDFAAYKTYSNYYEDYFFIVYGSDSLPTKITLPSRYNGFVSNVSYFRYPDFRSIAPAGDIDNDGFDDFLISTTEAGNPVYLIYGGMMFKQPRLPQYE